MKCILGASILAVLAVPLLLGTAFAGQFGPPEPQSDPGKFSLGLGYWWDGSKMKYDDRSVGVRSNQYYLQGNYSFSKDWEVYGRTGAADLTTSYHDHHRSTSDPDIFGTVGLKGVVYRYRNFSVGPFIEGSWYGDHGRTKNQWDTNFGASAQYDIRVGATRLSLYGGPFAYFHRADREYYGYSEDMKEKQNVGGFMGVKLPLTQKVSLTAEAQVRDRISTGALISYKF